MTAEKIEDPPYRAAPTKAPDLECDLVMKGGITSGVIYPGAIVHFAGTYRLRQVGGTSAGAIGAAMAAAAELGRKSRGFDKLAAVPKDLGERGLVNLFVPDPSTAPLMAMLRAYLGARKVRAAVGAACRSYWRALVLGAAPWLVAAVVLALSGIDCSWWIVADLVVLGLVSAGTSVVWRLNHTITRALPANLFGVCSGLGVPADDASSTGFTDWLSGWLDDLAGLPPGVLPLTFGDLLAPADPDVRPIDLRVITTCVSLGRPFELPLDSRQFYFDKTTWQTLFPTYVVDALVAASAEAEEMAAGDSTTVWLNQLARDRNLYRLPGAAGLPVVVATRLSLSFPGLISAVPMRMVDFNDPTTQATVRAFRAGQAIDDSVTFAEVWFSDGGLCSNFPVHLFDAALPTRPTFAINLGSFDDDADESPDENRNVEVAPGNQPLAPLLKRIPPTGWSSLGAFAGQAADTARNWQDNSYLGAPGHRDRIVRVLQTAREGGLNLTMDDDTITALNLRGRAAAVALIARFEGIHYPPSTPTHTGWENHQWVRLRALLQSLPDWLKSYADARAAGTVPVDTDVSYTIDGPAQDVATSLLELLDDLAAFDRRPGTQGFDQLMEKPNPQSAVRRVVRG